MEPSADQNTLMNTSISNRSPSVGTAQVVKADQVRAPKPLSFLQMSQVHLLIKHSPSFLRGSATRFLLALIMVKLSISPGSFPRELKSLQKIKSDAGCSIIHPEIKAKAHHGGDLS